VNTVHTPVQRGTVLGTAHVPGSFAEVLLQSHAIGLDSVVDFIDSPDISDIEHIDFHTPYSKVEGLLSAHRRDNPSGTTMPAGALKTKAGHIMSVLDAAVPCPAAAAPSTLLSLRTCLQCCLDHPHALLSHGLQRQHTSHNAADCIACCGALMCPPSNNYV
jgi:hypothetical protein